MNLSEETEKNISQLQLFEQNLQNLISQRQNFQMQELEIDHALEALQSTKDAPFKIVGGIMIATTKEELQKELNSKKELLSMRIRSIELQEQNLKQKAESLQQIIVKDLQKEEGKK